MRRAPLPPRELEVIVVQSQGMRRWLTLELADVFGCAGSLSLPFPAHFVRDISQRLAPDRFQRDEGDPYTREALAWRIDALLQALPADMDIYRPLRTYLAGNDARTRFGLAAQIAGRFDDYQMYRADLLEAWEAGHDTPNSPHARWQAELWRTLSRDIGAHVPHLAAQLRRTVRALEDGTAASLPTRVSVFGISSLPPLFIELLAALARQIPVTVYTASVTAEPPHPLAQLFGAQSRDFLAALSGNGADIVTLDRIEPAQARSSSGSPLLSTLQQEIATGASGDLPIALDTPAPSLVVHSAHGEMRQLELLRDQLLSALADDPTLRPHDLLLLVPDAAAWAPYVDAVFGVAGDDTARIPYRIADRPLRRTQPAAEALARIIALEGGRLARTDVFGALSHPLVMQAAGLTEANVDNLDELTARANVRWGYDADARVTLGLPAYEQASWRAGLDRLLLGVAMGEGDDLVLGLMAEAGDTAGDTETLATFANWIDTLASVLDDWKLPRTLQEWSISLSAAVHMFLRADAAGEQQQILDVLRTIQRLPVLSTLSGNTQHISFGVVRDWLENELDADSFGSGFLVGGMTIAALKPMRSLPFRIIAVAGLDDGVFPRRERRAAFDLLEQEPRRGDRDLRSDDRQLFLDLLLAAEDRVMIAYSGRAVSDNSERAPSVVIDELLDHLDRRTNGTARDRLVVRHPLQPFSPRYFSGDDPRLFTYSRAQARAARAGRSRRSEDLPFVESPLDTTSTTTPAALSLRDIGDCWTNPSKYFCRNTLRLSLGADDGPVSDDELFSLGPMESGGVKARILSARLGEDCNQDVLERRLIASGTLPFGSMAPATFQQLSADVDVVMSYIPDILSIASAIEISGDGWHLRGRLDGIRGDTRFIARAGSVRAEHRIRAWVEHVAMCAAHALGASDLPTRTVIVGKDGIDETLTPVPHATDVLNRLVRTAHDATRAPLPFFATAGWAWFDAMRPKKRKSVKDPRSAATKEFHKQSGDFSPMGGDCEDVYIELCFRGVDPMVTCWDEFESLTRTLFDPWIALGVKA